MRLIDEKALKEYQMQIPPEWIKCHLDIVKGMVEIFTRAIEAQPTIDAEPIVRCKDCKHFVYFNNRPMCARTALKVNGNYYGLVVANETHYCGYGAKMDGKYEMEAEQE